jgi:site-specific DNA recombinase
VPEAGELTATEAQVSKLRQGTARLIDSYAEGLIDKGGFEPRICRLRQRLGHLEEQAHQLADLLKEQDELRLIVGQVESFAGQVRQGLADADWLTRRELIRLLVKRVVIGRGDVKVVFRVPHGPFVPNLATDVLPVCRRGDTAQPSGVPLSLAP